MQRDEARTLTCSGSHQQCFITARWSSDGRSMLPRKRRRKGRFSDMSCSQNLDSPSSTFSMSITKQHRTQSSATSYSKLSFSPIYVTRINNNNAAIRVTRIERHRVILFIASTNTDLWNGRRDSQLGPRESSPGASQQATARRPGPPRQESMLGIERPICGEPSRKRRLGRLSRDMFRYVLANGLPATKPVRRNANL